MDLCSLRTYGFIVFFVEEDRVPKDLDKTVFLSPLSKLHGNRWKDINVLSGDSGDVRNTNAGSQTLGGGPGPPTVSL